MTRQTNVVLLLPLIFAGVGTSCGTDGIDGPGADFQITPASLALLPGESAQLTATSSGTSRHSDERMGPAPKRR